MVGIPAIVLNLVLGATGHDYLPEFMRLVGLPSELLALGVGIGGFISAYIAGRLISSAQRYFNQAREKYEAIVRKEGYWFDHRSEPDHYSNVRRVLEDILYTYDKLLSQFKSAKRRDDLTIQRLMVLYYQKTLVLCTIGRYEDAHRAIQLTKQCKDFLHESTIWEPGERATSESQYLFLEGEINLMLDQRDKAKDLFQQSLNIDRSAHDSAGMSKNQERLAMCAE